MQIIFKIKDILLAIQNLKKKFAKRSRLKQDKKIGMVSTALTNIQFSSIQSWLDDHNNIKSPHFSESTVNQFYISHHCSMQKG